MSSLRTALNAGFDVMLGPNEEHEPWPRLAALFSGSNRCLRLIIVPDMAHKLITDAETESGKLTLAKIFSGMTDDQRHAVASVLRAGAVGTLFITPERLAQQKFIQFLKEVGPRVIVIASAQRSCVNEADYRTAYDSLSVLRASFPRVPIVALLDRCCDATLIHALVTGLSLRLTPTKTTATSSKKSVTPNYAKGVESVLSASSTGWERAFPFFDEKKNLVEVADALEKDDVWCADALLHFIRQTGRTNPFPWVDQPTYLVVSMAAGQAETNDPNVVLPILGERVSASCALCALAALDNRMARGPRCGP